MARTKRKVNPIIPAPAVELETPSAFLVAGYVRLSTEDSGKLGADVIEAQKEMVASYIEQQPDMRLHKIYCDNGWTGTNFERPGFECLMNDVRSGKVNCIVVKDLSRFGRNYKEAGHYLEHIFPYLVVRFIAINDHFDTADQGIHDGYIVPLTNILNESYSRDISRKISSAIKTKELHGDFRGPFAPYGYSKCPADHSRLEINPETAPVVMEIFALRMQGMGYTGIARLLNKRGVPAPGAYLYQKGLSDRETYRDALWTAWNMKTILHSEVYLGHLIQGKRTQVSYKRKREERYAPADEWRVARNTHPPIIDEATFAAVQELAKQSKASFEAMPGKGAADDLKTPNLFKKLIYCADCGKAMNRRHLYSRKAEGRVYYYSYQCVTSQKLPGACSPKNLMESELMAVVSSAIRQQLDTIAALEERVSKEYASASSEKRRTLDRQIAQVKQDQSRSQTLLDGLYQNLVDGMLTREEYLSMKGHYQKRFDDATLRLADLNAQLQQLERYGPSNPMFAVCRTLRNTEGLTEELIHLLVSRIEVHDGNRLDIKLVYQDEVEALLRFLREGGTSL